MSAQPKQQMCIGSDLKLSRPAGSTAVPSSVEVRDGVTLRTQRYHCAPCFEIYRRRYG